MPKSTTRIAAAALFALAAGLATAVANPAPAIENGVATLVADAGHKGVRLLDLAKSRIDQPPSRWTSVSSSQ